jgi:hypothetical protein
MTGWVSCDDIETLFDDEVRADLGAVTAAAISAPRPACELTPADSCVSARPRSTLNR